MKQEHYPQIDARYWTAILLASVFGTNMGDLFAYRTGLGFLQGIGILAGLAAIVFVAESDESRPHELFYWLVVVIIRIGAANISDYTAYRTSIPDPLLFLIFATLIVIFGAATRCPSNDGPGNPWNAIPGTNLFYWLAMLSAGILGTITGDYCEHFLGRGTAAIVIPAIFSIAVAIGTRALPAMSRASLPTGRKRCATHLATYWAAIAAAGAAGTTAGDWLGDSHIIPIGPRIATAVSCLAFVAVVVARKGAPQTRRTV